MPALRSLATQLNTARGTVELAYTILLDEGYLQMRGAAGTFVSPSLPASVTHSSRMQNAQNSNGQQRTKAAAAPQAPSESRGAELPPRPIPIAAAMSGEPRPLQPGLPALDAFPVKLWNRLVSHRARSGERTMLAYPDPVGYRPLREHIATYLGLSRGVTYLPD
ncbi:DNA-binding transcriptional MocR family regulator [Paraburkholderia sp. MM5384-R2]|nr:DNA-binding transcriptional MocR family regulator [Paraburkholderia sp. MM5384-R2]